MDPWSPDTCGQITDMLNVMRIYWTCDMDSCVLVYIQLEQLVGPVYAYTLAFNLL